MGESLISHLEGLGFQATWYRSGEEACIGMDGADQSDIVISDIRLPDLTGEEIFHFVRARFPDVPCILITAFGKVDQAVRMMKEGLDDYVTKPFDVSDLVEKIVYLTNRKEENRLARYLVDDLCLRMGKGELVAGTSAGMRKTEDLVQRVRDLPTTILLTGESGTGKEVIANLCHFSGIRKDKPFIALHCAAIPSSLLESELFGYEVGAFTGAVKMKPGKFELADGGTIFFDEIGEISPEMQIKLLRVLQEREFERLGGTKTISVDVRIIAATNRELKELVEAGKFREDLFYRINVIPIHVPPLRERREDILFFARYFLRFFADQLGRPFKVLSPLAEAALLSYNFPGNIRELKNLIERVTAMSDREIIGPEDIFPANDPDTSEPVSNPTLKSAVAETERHVILRTLQDVDHVVVRAAEILGISRKTLWEKMKRYGIPSGKNSREI